VAPERRAATQGRDIAADRGKECEREKGATEVDGQRRSKRRRAAAESRNPLNLLDLGENFPLQIF
jgi:hypothetical protein